MEEKAWQRNYTISGCQSSDEAITSQKRVYASMKNHHIKDNRMPKSCEILMHVSKKMPNNAVTSQRTTAHIATEQGAPSIFVQPEQSVKLH